MNSSAGPLKLIFNSSILDAYEMSVLFVAKDRSCTSQAMVSVGNDHRTARAETSRVVDFHVLQR